ncbi:MAG: hypothetical protein C0404_06350 [Verrucomicrobia bacterium]|nr:hypothetical protein [Verrucomicrobiota bacterium]
MISNRHLVMILLPVTAALFAGCASTPPAREIPFWEIPPGSHPPVTAVPLNLRPEHPRLIFKSPANPGPGRTAEDIRKIRAEDPTFQKLFAKALQVPISNQHPAMLAACWMVTGEDRFAEQAVKVMLEKNLGKSGEPYYSEIWSYAMAYDWLFHHPAMTFEKRQRIEIKIAERLGTELNALDQQEMALWHGRNQAANGAMIAALAIGDLPGQKSQLRRAAGHYLDCLRALQLSEGWPEGASYWIYNRAGPYAVASDCVMTALNTNELDGIQIREVMRKIGYWQLYQFAPNETFEPYGDSQGSLLLGETGWWELTTDYYARLSRDPGLMAGADYIRNRSPAPYGQRPYYWYAAITYEPAVRPRDDYDPARPELWMRKNLPQAMLFGRNSMGVAFMRGNWGDRDETYATFKAGDLMAHHDHYDVGHFAIQKGGLLAPLTGLYGGNYTGRHRLGYAIQTVSANSLLILAPGETSTYLANRNDKIKWSSISGGQRVMRPTGFTCCNLRHYGEMLNDGPHLERADITAYESSPGQFDYFAADITAAYNSTRFAEPGRRAKVSLVTRQFLHLRQADAFVIYDRVETTDPKFLPKFLLHSLTKPVSATEKQLAGDSPDNGILETADRTLSTTNQRGILTHHVVLPPDARALKIGGTNYNCYVETDGDQSNGFNGDNLGREDPLKPRRGAQLGLWRTEIEPTAPRTSTRFLNVLVAGLTNSSTPAITVKSIDAGESAHAVLVGNTVVVFNHDPAPLKSVVLALPAEATCLIMNAQPGATYRIGDVTFKASPEGVLQTGRLPAGRHTVSAGS